MDKSQIIAQLEKELAFAEIELKKVDISVSLENEKYWVSRKYYIIKQLRELDCKIEEDLAQDLEVELKFAKKELRLASKESSRIIKRSQHWVWYKNEIMKQLKWRKEVANG